MVYTKRHKNILYKNVTPENQNQSFWIGLKRRTVIKDSWVMRPTSHVDGYRRLERTYGSMSMLVFWVVMPCGLVSRYQPFGKKYYLHLHPFSESQSFPLERWYLSASSHGATAHSTNLDTFTVIKTSTLSIHGLNSYIYIYIYIYFKRASNSNG
jgi:hypothetical protein